MVTTEGESRRGVPRIAWILLGVFLVALGLLAILSRSVLPTEQQDLGFEGITRLEFDAHNAPFTITGSSDASNTSVSVTSTTGFLGGSVSIEPVGSTLRIVHRCPTGLGFGCRASFEITVPEDTIVNGTTSNGAIAISAVSGAIDVRTSNGAISLSGTVGQVLARTSNGAVTGQGIGSSSVDVQTSNGRIEMEFSVTPGSVTLRTSNGRVDVLIPADAPAIALSTSTSNGRVDSNIRTDPASSHRVEVRTSNGNIDIRYR